MKKFALLFTVAVLFSAAGCGKEEQKPAPQTAPKGVVAPEQTRPGGPFNPPQSTEPLPAQK